MKDWNTKSDPLFDKFNNVTTGRLSTIEARYAETDFLRFDTERILKLAEGFDNAQVMIDYKGENEKLINAAGRYIQSKIVERPEWFSDAKLNQTKEEVFEEVSQLTGYFADLDWNVQQKCWRHWDTKELRKVFPNLKWRKEKRDDAYYIEKLSQFKDASSMRNHSMEMGNIFSKVRIDGGVKYPKAYALSCEMLKGHSNPRPKRGSYKQRTPLVEMITLDGEVLGAYTWAELKEMGYNRNTVTGAIRGQDGHHKAKGHLWKYQGKEFGEGAK